MISTFEIQTPTKSMLIQILLNKPIAINQTMGGPKPTLHIAGTLFHKREVNRVFFYQKAPSTRLDDPFEWTTHFIRLLLSLIIDGG